MTSTLVAVLLPPIVTGLFLGSMVVFWWTAKRMARLLDRPYLWDAADGIVGLLTGVLAFPMTLPLVQHTRPEHGVTTSPGLFALRNSAALALAMTIGFVYLSVAIEQQFDGDVPASLVPIEERVWDHHLGWIPWCPDDGWRGPRLTAVPGIRRLVR